MDWQWPLLAVSGLFVAVTVWRVRPVLPPTKVLDRKRLHTARTRLETATSDAERSQALCEAGETSALAGRVTSAEGYFLRAMRAQPHDAAPVERAALAMARYPRALEALLWRRLGAEAWHAPNRQATLVTLRYLQSVYDGPLGKRVPGKRVQARALEFARDALEADSLRPAPMAEDDSTERTKQHESHQDG